MTDKRVAILGAGPAGMACALWCKRAGLEPVLIEQSEAAGGLSRLAEWRNDWMLGQPGRLSNEFAADWARHVTLEDISLLTHAWVESAEPTSHGIRLNLILSGETPLTLDVGVLVIATGEQPRGAESFRNLPGFDAVEEAGLISFTPGSEGRGAECAGKRVLVIGGGDNAYCAAERLLPYAQTLALVQRGAPRAQSGLKASLEPWKGRGLTAHTGLAPAGFVLAHGHVTLQCVDTEQNLVEFEADRIFARLGYAPNSEAPQQFLQSFGWLGLHPTGHIVVDADQRTNIARVYAVGDVANSAHPSVVTAMASGAVAARALEKEWFRAA